MLWAIAVRCGTAAYHIYQLQQVDRQVQQLVAAPPQPASKSAEGVHPVHSTTASAEDGAATPQSLLSETDDPMVVHLFIQPRWPLAPSLSPACTEVETMLRLLSVPYAVHEVHVLRVDAPVAQSTDPAYDYAPEAPLDSSSSSSRASSDEEEDRGPGHSHHHHCHRDGDMKSSSILFHREQRRRHRRRPSALVQSLTRPAFSTIVRQSAADFLRRWLPRGKLPSDLKAAYPLPFLIADGRVLTGSCAELREQLAVVRPSIFRSPAALPFMPLCSTDTPSPLSESAAVTQAVEKTVQYALRLLYHVGLVLDGAAVYCNYAVAILPGYHRLDLLQTQYWAMRCWVALPFFSRIKADALQMLQAYDVGRLSPVQLQQRLHCDIVSLEQLLLSSAAPDKDAEGLSAVQFLLGPTPGPADCALYSYLLPILRLSPAEVTQLGNPNYTYLHQSKIFRCYLARMTAAAFPDLVSLLPPVVPHGWSSQRRGACNWLSKAQPYRTPLHQLMHWLRWKGQDGRLFLQLRLQPLQQQVRHSVKQQMQKLGQWRRQFLEWCSGDKWYRSRWWSSQRQHWLSAPLQTPHYSEGQWHRHWRCRRSTTKTSYTAAVTAASASASTSKGASVLREDGSTDSSSAGESCYLAEEDISGLRQTPCDDTRSVQSHQSSPSVTVKLRHSAASSSGAELLQQYRHRGEEAEEEQQSREHSTTPNRCGSCKKSAAPLLPNEAALPLIYKHRPPPSTM